MRRRRLIAALLLGGGLPGACTSPNPRLYTLAPIPGPVVRGGPHVVLLREIGLARYLERSQIVRSSEDFRLNVLSNDWWGEPLSAMLSRVLAVELEQRLPDSVVYGENGAVTTPPDATIELNVQRLDKNADGRIVLVAQVGLLWGAARRAPVTRGLRYEVTPDGAGLAAEVAAMSRALAQLADALAGLLRARPA